MSRGHAPFLVSVIYPTADVHVTQIQMLKIRVLSHEWLSCMPLEPARVHLHVQFISVHTSNTTKAVTTIPYCSYVQENIYVSHS